MTEERVSNYEDRSIENVHLKNTIRNIKKKKRKLEKLSGLWDNNRRSNICVIGVAVEIKECDKTNI